MDWRYLFAIKYLQRNLQTEFPDERLGVGDRFILNMISNRDVTKIIERYRLIPKKPAPEGEIWMRIKKQKERTKTWYQIILN